ncbi:MAG: hypothetical protein KKG87_05180 [Elusimicrobia bacterium]|nr:hypothetical protein [Elusimicrobiota bacterium]
MQNTKIKILTILLPLMLCCSLLRAASVAPYYDFQFTQGAAIPSRGSSEFSLNLVNDVGLLAKIHPRHTLVGFYEIKYVGPGLRQEEGESFSDRYMDYLLVVRHNWVYNNKYTFKAQLDNMIENRRTGANEAWGYGLYDYVRSGGMVDAEINFETFKLDSAIQYSVLTFPNYTDLVSELQSGSADAESQSGKQDHNLIQIRSNLDYEENRFSFGLTLQNYIKQKVITNVTQPDGTYYSSDLQRDIILNLGAERTQKFSESIIMNMFISYKNRGSNQNYQHFLTAGSTVPVSYQADFNSYSEISAGFPVTFALAKKWDFVFSPEYKYKFYSSRSPRDENNLFVGGRQSTTLFLLSFAFNKKSSDVSTTSLFYTFQQQSSNMKFEKYMPYNYSGHFIGIRYSLRY